LLALEEFVEEVDKEILVDLFAEDLLEAEVGENVDIAVSHGLLSFQMGLGPPSRRYDMEAPSP